MPYIEEVPPQKNTSESNVVGYCLDTVFNQSDIVSTWLVILGVVLIVLGLCVMRIRSRRRAAIMKNSNAKRDTVVKVISKKVDKDA